MKSEHWGIAAADMSGLLRDGVVRDITDEELLKRFTGSRDRGAEIAFEVLVARHGPMVLGVCRRFLRDPAEVDDAFQATFLVLARRAGAIRLTYSLAPWLHGVSRRVARRLQSVANRRAAIMHQDDLMESIPDRYREGPAEVERRLDVKEALETLPDNFREALILCYIEGLTHEEAALRLGCPVGTVRSRLARGRALLRHCLSPWESGASSPSRDTLEAARSGRAPSILAPSLIKSTARAAARLAAGHPLAGVVPARVVEVATGVCAAMFRTKLAATGLVVVLATLAGWGAWAGTSGTGQDAGRPGKQADKPAVAPRGDFDGKRVSLRRDKQGAKPAAELPADFPAFVVETQPKLGDTDVDPATVKEIRVTFSKPMMDKSWSWTQGNVYAFPETTGPIHYLPDQKTCVMPVKLEAGKTYVMGINGGRFENFKDKAGRPSLHYGLGFRTRAAK
jgi:RNA polymerase sigma factor (sigma-70 family)